MFLIALCYFVFSFLLSRTLVFLCTGIWVEKHFDKKPSSRHSLMIYVSRRQVHNYPRTPPPPTILDCYFWSMKLILGTSWIILVHNPRTPPPPTAPVCIFIFFHLGKYLTMLSAILNLNCFNPVFCLVSSRETKVQSPWDWDKCADLCISSYSRSPAAPHLGI